MKRYLELGIAFQDQFNTLAMVLAIEFRKLREGESLLWLSADTDGMQALEDATNDLPDLVTMQFIPPFPEDTWVVTGSVGSVLTVQERLAALIWGKASPGDEADFYDYLEKHHSEYWESLTSEQQERRIADDVAWYEETRRKREEDKRYLTSLPPEQREREEKRRDDERLASMLPKEREEELQRRRRIHFGTLGIPMNEILTFIETGEQYAVASGSGRPENGGRLLFVQGEGLVSIRLLTRKLMGEKFDEGGDVWALWEYHGETLRSIYGKNFRDG